jgi:hypothetical protein
MLETLANPDRTDRISIESVIAVVARVESHDIIKDK